MKARIDLGGAQLTAAAEAAVLQVLRSGWPGPGPVAEQFEKAFAGRCGAEHAVSLNSGTAALHLAVRLLDLPEGTEVITTPMTFLATNAVLLYERLVPVFADIEARTGNICVDSVATHVTPSTGAIMVTHYAGYACDLEAIYALADAHNLPVIEDCAHATGATYRGEPIGSHRGLQAFSFQATKNLSAVDGGMLLTRNAKEAERARCLRWMGIDTSTHSRTAKSDITNAYSVSEIGYRYAMSDLNAAIALAQLEHLEEGNARRRSIAQRYTEAFSDQRGVRVLERSADRQTSNHLFPLLCENRDELAAGLLRESIVTGRHYQCNSDYAVFPDAEVPNAQAFSRQVLTLPIHLGLSDDDVDRVIAAVAALA